MSATIKSDGSISFNDSKSLLSIEMITNQALKLMADQQECARRYEQHSKIAELRKSCGIESPPLTIKMPVPYTVK